ncbi:MAG: hypothetical protein NC822_06670 [Candidatus Omnitrophica bacterium]|nr:hypothetical protein [Candidatus Omnitrophota bacterium]MCM8826810.1 hypothetical protein [Candidatus Omnitrophota bacterium]
MKIKERQKRMSLSAQKEFKIILKRVDKWQDRYLIPINYTLILRKNR